MARILLVEDNEMNRDMLSRRLQRRGFEVSVAVDGAESVEKARSGKPDLILMDMGLPVLDGYQATRLIKSSDRTRFIPVLGLSAHAMSGDAERALEAGCDDYDTKPVDWRRLMEKIEKLLSREPKGLRESEAAHRPGLEEGPIAGHVLVADDDAVNREILCRRLRSLGYSFELVKDGLDALHVLERKPFDAVLLDLALPSIDGLQVLQRMRSDQQLRRTPCLVVVPADAVDRAVEAIDAGAEDYVPKPFNREVLGVRLRSALERRRLRERLEKAQPPAPKRNGDPLSSEAFKHLMPELVAEEIKVTTRVPARRHDGAALLCLGLSAFQELYATTPDWLVQSLRRVNEACDGLVETSGLAKIHGFGRVYEAASGLFMGEANPALQAVRCALACIEAVRALDLELELRAGLHVGPVVGGMADARRFRFDLWGENVRVAEGIQHEAESGAIYVSAPVWKQIADVCHGIPAGRLSGIGEDALTLYRVERILVD